MSRRLGYLGGWRCCCRWPRAPPAPPRRDPCSGPRKAGTLSAPMQTVLLLTALTLLPAALVSVTPFLRTIIVLHFLRQALGTQTAPSNQVLVGLALFLTLLTMQPIAGQIYDKAWTPLENGQMTVEQAAQEAAQPLRQFWLRFATREGHCLVSGGLAFAGAAHTGGCGSESPDSGLHSVGAEGLLPDRRGALPAFSGDRPGGGLGDTVSVGMMQLPPVMISAPFKILLFVLVDGWNLVVGSLMKSFS